MKKILAVIGSPRKGETYKAVQRFEEEMNKLEPVEVEYVMLSKLALMDCTGCHNCVMKGRDCCRESAKILELQGKMLNADGVILATPVYNQHVTALMKKFMDYFTFLWHRPEMFGVKFAGVSSGGGMFKPVFQFLKMNVESWGGTWVDGLGVAHYEALTDKYKAKLDVDITKKAEVFLKAMEGKKLPKPSFGRLMWFNMWKLNASACKDSIPEDFKYWTEKNWFGMQYYYDTKIGIIKKAAVSIAARAAKCFMRRVYKGY